MKAGKDGSLEETQEPSVSQLPPSTFQMVEGENFVKDGNLEEKFHLRQNSQLLNAPTKPNHTRVIL